MLNQTHNDEHHGALCAGCELSQLDLDFREYGTRFRLFPQSPLLSDYQEPETVWLSIGPDQIWPGPSDDRMYVVDAIDKKPYGDNFSPPYKGNSHRPATPSASGHFDHLEVGTHQFEAAHMYGTLRWVLDIWERYFNRELEWSFNDHFERLELVPWLDWDNAHAGYGFVETGYGRDDDGSKFPYNLNFDVLAHEFGHTMLYSVIGLPIGDDASTEFFAFHETSGDLVAILSVLHFNSVIDRILEETSGNLYTRNTLNRLGEESSTRQIRMASNGLKMADVADVRTPMKQLTNKQVHDLSLPMTGALFDLLVEVFQHNLVDAGLISPELDQASRSVTEKLGNESDVTEAFQQSYQGNQRAFKKALVDARDYLGLVLANSWSTLDPQLNFPQFIHSLFNADLAISGGHYQQEIDEVFRWREIRY